MEPAFHRFTDLFTQLGLPSDVRDIGRFINANTPLPGELAIADAPWWSPSQATWLRQVMAEDADWALLVDQLSLALRSH